MCISLIIHPVIAVVNYFIGRSIGIVEVPLLSYFVIIPVISFISALPISVAGWGVGEALYVSLLGLMELSLPN